MSGGGDRPPPRTTRQRLATMRLNGILRFPPGEAPVRVSLVRVSLRDITEMGGPAPVVAEVQLPGLEVPADGAELAFTLDADVPPGRVLAIRVHADVSGSGAVERGDLVTTSTHLVDPAASAAEAVVTLERVGSTGRPTPGG